MSVHWRMALLMLATVVLAPAVWHVVLALPAFGAPTEQYGAAVNALLTATRHVTNMVAAVNFDVRGSASWSIRATSTSCSTIGSTSARQCTRARPTPASIKPSSIEPSGIGSTAFSRTVREDEEHIAGLRRLPSSKG